MPVVIVRISACLLTSSVMFCFNCKTCNRDHCVVAMVSTGYLAHRSFEPRSFSSSCLDLWAWYTRSSRDSQRLSLACPLLFSFRDVDRLHCSNFHRFLSQRFHRARCCRFGHTHWHHFRKCDSVTFRLHSAAFSVSSSQQLVCIEWCVRKWQRNLQHCSKRRVSGRKWRRFQCTCGCFFAAYTDTTSVGCNNVVSSW